LVDLAKICEEVGFHGVFVSDHVVHPERFEPNYPYSPDGRPMFDAQTEWPDPWVAIAAMATATQRLHFTTGVYIAPLRHPLEIAKSIGIASVLSQGRTALGAGIGWMKEEFEILGEDFHTRGKRMDECIEILRRAWTGETFDYAGQHYSVPRVTMRPAPKTRIPIYIGGASVPALRRAARNDGWFSNGSDPQEVAGIVSQLKAFRTEQGCDGGEFEVILALTSPPDFDEWRRFEDLGVTGMISYPLNFTIGAGTTVQQKREALEQYANGIIARF
ncbi:MAG: TIGR03619 family F420-dependent LLM class oxidoreductase, partial [Myxococcota bacterium]